MVQFGKVAGNLMIDVRATNAKLRDRAVRIVQALTGADADIARDALERTRWKVQAPCARAGRGDRAHPHEPRDSAGVRAQ